MQKKFSIILLVFSMVLASVTISMAADVCFSWTKNPNLEGKDTNDVVGYRIYRDPTTEVEFIFPDIIQSEDCVGNKCEKCLPKIDDNKNHRYAATAYNDVGESDFSQTADDLIVVEKRTVPPVGQAPGPVESFLRYLITVEKVQ